MYINIYICVLDCVAQLHIISDSIQAPLPVSQAAQAAWRHMPSVGTWAVWATEHLASSSLGYFCGVIKYVWEIPATKWSFRWTNHRKRSRRYFFQQAMLDCQRIFALHCWSSGNCSWFLRCFSCIWMCFYVSFLRHFWSDSRRLYHWEFVGKMVAAVALIVFWKW